jgi:hypothetical protein
MDVGAVSGLENYYKMTLVDGDKKREERRQVTDSLADSCYGMIRIRE